MSVEGLAASAQFRAQTADPRFLLRHRRQRQADLGGGHLVWPASLASAGAGAGAASPAMVSSEMWDRSNLAKSVEFPDQQHVHATYGLQAG